MTVNIYIPGDSGSLALAADKVALAIASEAEERGLDIKIVRNGSRGLYWLEPMVEVETFEGRVAYGPVKARDVKSLFDAGLAEGKGDHGLSLGDPEEIPFLKRQTRLTFARCGIVDPLSLEDYRAHGGIRGLEKALAMSPEEIVAEVTESGLRGRGGAGFPTGIKWKTVLEAQADRKYIVCNGDEGDSGTFADRMILEGDPFVLIEGMVIAGLAVGATKGYIYMRSEYPHAIEMTEKAIEIARDANILGPSVLMSGQAFELEVRVGAGAYVCGEETALLESLEGRRGEVRARPPFPAQEGLFGKPTIVNNVLTLAMAAAILREGAEAVAALGTEKSRGTVVAQIVGRVPKPICVEIPFGVTVGEMMREYSGVDGVTAIQVGGPLGSVFRTKELDDVELSFEGLTEAGGLLGHGGFVCYGEDFSPREEVIHWMDFFAAESCGKCTPCRIGTRRALEILDRVGTGEESDGDRDLLTDLDEVMTNTSLCALGGLAMNPVRSTMEKWPEAFAANTEK